MGKLDAVFVVVTALAVVFAGDRPHCPVHFQLRRTAAQVEKTVADLNAKLTPLISRVQILVEDVSPRITGIVADASEITRLARGPGAESRPDPERGARAAAHAADPRRSDFDRRHGSAWKKRDRACGRRSGGLSCKATAVVRGVQAGIDFFRSSRQRRSRPIDPVEAAANSRTKECLYS